MKVTVRPLSEHDFDAALVLYNTLGGTPPPLQGAEAKRRFAQILAHPGTLIFGAAVETQIVAMATLHILPNMTAAGRPYALIENVVTLKKFERQGLARAVMEQALSHAWENDAYKIMLLTGRTANANGFYEKLGFSGDDKHAMTLRKTPPRLPTS